MSQEMMAAVALAVGIAVAIPTYRWARKKKTKSQKRLEKNKKAGRCAIGEYHSSKVLPGDLRSNDARMRHDSLLVKYKYTVNGMDYYKTMIFQSQGRIGTDFPKRVEVYYDAGNPKKAVCPEEAHPSTQIQSGCLTTIAITFIAMFLCFQIMRILLG